MAYSKRISFTNMDTQRFEGQMVKALDLVVDEDENVRAFQYKLDDLRDLLADFEAGRTLKHPITVDAVKGEDGNTKPVVRIGFRRATAAQVFAKSSPERADFRVPVLIQSFEDKRALITANVRENTATKKLNPIDQGYAVELLEAEGVSHSEIAELLNVSKAQVTQLAKLRNELDERAQRLVATRQMTMEEAFALLQIPDPQVRVEKLEEILEETGRAEPKVEVPDQDGEVGPARRARVGSRASELRKAARDSGGKVALRMPELKKYLEFAIETEGPGSHPGEVLLKKYLLEFINGEKGEKWMDKKFGEICKTKGF